MKEEYRPQTREQKLGYLLEESGEVLAALGKSMRWGLESVNPELPPEQQETNRAWLVREIRDVRSAIGIFLPLLRGDQRQELSMISDSMNVYALHITAGISDEMDQGAMEKLTKLITIILNLNIEIQKTWERK